MKTAVLLLSYGSPEKMSDIDEYLSKIFGGKPVPKGVAEENYRKYEMFGGLSPSNRIIQSIRDRLQKRFDQSGDVDVFTAFKHWYPSIGEVVPDLKGYDNIVSIPLFSFFSENVKASYYKPLAEALEKNDIRTKMEFVNGISNYDLFIPMWIHLIEEKEKGDSFYLFDAHSLPHPENEEDYLFWLRYSTYKITQIMGLRSSDFGFQGGHEGWLGPSIYNVYRKAKEKKIIAVPISFLYDHLEILYDLDYEFRKKIEEDGYSYERVPMPNDSAIFITLLERIVSSSITHLSGELIGNGKEKSENFI
ncbi:ferrochelatase [Thermoplasma volcanium GSS1]|uniref:Ferrochelatase n=1 Tax=Thermoplasma volcanium (strain ATCC 51530 / DSM 4299 / JCM 9571 / NBRC 15438 / GSS1) TaxID=273116 RepID=HEMH_THEVO|nr:ferrochelatase [Thermoplasma volcanium]Q978U9.1 RecName: Full=Ferrochelatase; AltName: Full=Heme synthase; AltName: Full=Protoheme ferro-lyase [Thermoplasma volcanium GSS1]BAB60458.1 ferrochelatase [Thermoplasma volcanium GSS1]